VKYTAILLPILAAGAWAQGNPPAPLSCSASMLNGVRAVTLTGRQVSAAGVVQQILFAVGTATFDGVSAVTFNLTADTNNFSGAAQKWSGTYAIPSNCLGTLALVSGGTASFTLIPYNNGDAFTITGQDATYSYTGSGSLMPASGCLTSSYTGSYAFSANGYGLNLGTISTSVLQGVANGLNTVAGILQFNGAGGASGSWSVATNGNASPATVSGTYSVASPGCAATVSLTDQNNVSYQLNLIASSADSANFDLIGASAASAATGGFGVVFSGGGHSTFVYPGLAVQNAAGISGGTPPGSLFSIYGYGLAVGKAQALTPTWPTTLASAQVTVNGELAPLYYADNNALAGEALINAQMPLDIPPGLATVVVKNGSSNSNAVAINVPTAANPGIFLYGANHAVAQNFPNYTLNSGTTPAKAGSVIVVYFTGGGAVQGGSSIMTGHPTPAAPYPLATTNVKVTIGGMPASVDYIGLTPTLIGVYQADIVVPKLTAGDHALVITIDGAASNSALVSIN
jgi:uncharacterized protein (TIGR03437 family)